MVLKLDFIEKHSNIIKGKHKFSYWKLKTKEIYLES